MKSTQPVYPAVTLAVVLVWPGIAHARDELVDAIAAARQHGCSGHEGVREALHPSAALSKAAARIQHGEGASQAIAKEGYRATRAFHTTFEGYRSASQVVSEFARFYCTALTDPAMADVGWHREGTRWIVVLASPLRFPQLGEREAVAAKVLSLVNEARSHPRRCGDRQFAPASPLHWSAQLEQAASVHAADMAAHSFVEHRGHDGSTPSQRVSRAGYDWRAVGENVAAGQASADEVVEDWLSSPGHCANIMEPSFTQMGVAYSVNMDAKAAVYWAQEFGRPR